MTALTEDKQIYLSADMAGRVAAIVAGITGFWMKNASPPGWDEA